ncbi:MAG: nitronate monooxygenase [Longimicrobiales bacterium]|nr:nitronate monooxygenase [Longimicrobiales bacterium]
MDLQTKLTEAANIAYPIICGAMYPCSNPELVAAASEAGGLGIVQPVSLTYVHGYEFREGLRKIKSLTSKPIGMNALIEASSRTYENRMKEWVDIALEEGVRFFVTSLGKPTWVVDAVEPHGGVVYHDVTERKWALKGLESGVHGLIAVNSRAGGHAGPRTPAELMDELEDLGVPIVCAGGIGTPEEFVAALERGYAGVQMGTRFIATTECTAAMPYKRAILESGEDDIVLTERVTGVPLSVIETPYIERLGTKAGPLARWMLKGRWRKRLMRTIYALWSGWRLKQSSYDESGEKDFWQAGRSVAGIDEIKPVARIIEELVAAARRA